jgi:hypothetical protein
MMLSAPLDPRGDPLKERILTIGTFGTGKSRGWLKVAEWLQRTESPGMVYVLDTDSAATRMLAAPGEFGDLGNVTVAEAYEWGEYERTVDAWLPILRPHDWLVVDFASSAWDAVQDWYTETMYKQDIASFFLQAAMNQKAGNPLDGWKDWSIINRVYRRWIDKIIHKVPCHVYMTSPVETLRDTDSAENRAVFGRFGVRPRGQKHLAHQVHSVLLLQTTGGQWFLNTIKDRGRPVHAGLELTDFAIDYLVNTGGWGL